MVIRKFRSEDFPGVVECYNGSFPRGHNQYSLARLFRWTESDQTTFVAEENGKIVGVVIGLCTYERAWITGLAVAPGAGSFWFPCVARLLLALIFRFEEMGYGKVYGTTELPKMKTVAEHFGAELVEEVANFFFDSQPRWVYCFNVSAAAKYKRLLKK